MTGVPSASRPPAWAPRAAPFLLWTLLVIVVWADPLATGRSFGGRDLVPYNLPMEENIHDAYSRGRLPVWSAEISGGRPLLPNPNAGALYPLRMLLSAASFPTAMRIFPVLHWALAGCGMLVLLRRLGASAAGAWVAAATYAFSGVAISLVFYPHIQPGMALLPWALWAVCGATGSVSTIPLAIVFGLLCLAGDVFTVGMAALAAVLWTFLEVPRPARGRELGKILAAACLGGLLAAPQILATLLWVPETNRSISGIDLREALFFSIPPWRLLELVIPFPFGATWSLERARVWGTSVFNGRPLGIYATLYAGAFAVIAAAAVWREKAPGVRFARALLVLALALSVPPSLIPEGWSRLPSPLPLRNPEKFALALSFALALLAGLGLEKIRRSRRLPRAVLVAFVGLCLASFAIAIAPGPSGRAAATLLGEPRRVGAAAARELRETVTEAGLAWAATTVAVVLLRRPGRAAELTGVLLLTLVPLAVNRKIAPTFREEEIFSPTASVRAVALEDPGGSFRTLSETVFLPDSRLESLVSESDPAYVEFPRRNWYEHSQALWDRGTVFNYDFDRGDFSRMWSLREYARRTARAPQSEVLFAGLGLKFGVRFRDQRPLPGYVRFGGDLLQDWDALASASPDVRILSRWREEDGAVAALSALSSLAPGEVVLETGRRGAGASDGGRLRVLERSPERLRLDVETPDGGWLFVLRGYWSHRTVLRDGSPVETVPAMLAFTAVGLPAGTHRIDWRERVPGLSISAWGPVLFLLGVALVRSRRRDARADR